MTVHDEADRAFNCREGLRAKGSRHWHGGVRTTLPSCRHEVTGCATRAVAYWIGTLAACVCCYRAVAHETAERSNTYCHT
jgi:hypothetical protein